jgi:aryl-alcohol dehydrogenase-like predicted oxidoreductase
MLKRQLGSTDIEVSTVALGCWPISGMSSLDVTEADSLATLDAAIDVGINFLDTAYAYGAAGESDCRSSSLRRRTQRKPYVSRAKQASVMPGKSP